MLENPERSGTEQNRTEQNRTEQNRTEQNRTEQNRTEQNRTELEVIVHNTDVAVLAWLCLQVQSKHTQIQVLLLFTRTKQPRTFPTIRSNPCAAAMFKARSQQYVTGRSKDQHQDQYSRWRHRTTFSGQRTSYHASHVLHAQKAFNFELRLFKKCCYFHAEKQTVGISVKQLI